MKNQKKYKFNIADLLEQEVDYELEIRDMMKTGSLDEKRKRLRPILRDESESVLGYNLTRQTCKEIEYCSERIACIEQELCNNPGNHYDLRSSLVHCYLRVKRLKSDISNNGIINNILSTCEENLAKHFPTKARKSSAKANAINLSDDLDYSSGESNFEDCDTENEDRNNKTKDSPPQNYLEYEKTIMLNLAVENKLKRLDRELAEIEKFKLWLRSKRYSESTITTYADALKTFLRFYANKPIAAITNDDIIQFNNQYILANKFSASFQNQVVNAVKLFFRKIEHTAIEIDLIHIHH